MYSLTNSQALGRLVKLWLKFSFAVSLISVVGMASPSVANAACTCGFAEGIVSQTAITVVGIGMADGYGLPGTLTRPETQAFTGAGSTSQMKFQVSWALLGLGGFTAIRFHISTVNIPFNDTNLPNKIEANLGGCGGGPGSTQFAALTFVPDVALSGNQGATVTAVHFLTNDGNDDDLFDFTSGIAGAHTPTVMRVQ